MYRRSVAGEIRIPSEAFADTIIRSARAQLRPVVHLAREGLARRRLQTQSQGNGPLAVFIPSGPATGAALLRIYNVAKELRVLGWRSTVMPWKLTLGARHRFLHTACPDVVVMQGVRHPLNRPGLYPGQRIVLDVDDADFHLEHLADPMRRAMPDVAAVAAGSRYIADWAVAHGAPRATVIWTGTPVSDRAADPQTIRSPIVAWAQTRPETYGREARLVARVMTRVAAARPGVTLRLYDRRARGDETFLDQFRSPGLLLDWRAPCSYREYLKSFGDVAIGLAPLCSDTPFSRGKSFGKILAYLDRDVAVVGSAAGEQFRFFTEETAILSNNEDRWVAGIVSLLDMPALRQNLVDAAHKHYLTRLSTSAAAARLADLLATVADDGPLTSACS